MTPKQLRSALARFYKYLIVDHGVARITAEGYCRTLSPVLKSIDSVRPSHATLRNYLFRMHQKHASYNHILNTTLAAEHYTAHKGYALKLGRAKKPRRMIPQTLSEAEVSRIIQSAPDIRQQALVALLAFSGMRNQELCRLKVSQLDPAQNHIKVAGGKGQKDRLVNISTECTKLVLLYLAAFPRGSDAFLFTTIRRATQLQTGDVRKIVRTVAAAANINRRVHPHLFRHSLATNLLNRGASLLTIREQLGHAFIESTMIYTHPMPARARAEYDFFKPAYL